MTIKLSKQKIFVILLGLAFWCVLIISYLWAMQIHFSYRFKVDFNALKCFFASICLLALFFALPDNDTIYSFFTLVILCIVVLPMGCVYCCTDGSTIYFFLVSILYFGIELLVDRFEIGRINVLMKDRFSNFSLNTAVVAISILVVITTIFLLYIKKGIPSFRALDFSAVYLLRESNDSASFLFTLAKLCTQVFIPLLLAISFISHRKICIILLLLAQFVIYLWLAHKAILFSILIMIVGYGLSKTRKRNILFIAMLVISVSISTVLEGNNQIIADEKSLNIYTLYSLLVRRSLIVPAYLKQFYYLYFVVQGNKLVGLFGTFIAPLLTRLNVPNAYSDVSYSQVIGELYSNGSNANTGMFGGELAHFGIWGLFVAALCFLFILLCVKSSEEHAGKSFTCCLSLYSIMNLTNGKALEVISFTPLFVLCILLITMDVHYNTKNNKVKFALHSNRVKARVSNQI